MTFLGQKPAPGWEFVSLEHSRKFASFELGRKLPSITLAPRARQVADVRYDGQSHVLVVAPVKGGGYCYSWRGPYLGSECRLAQGGHQPIDAHVPGDASGPIVLYGTFTPADAATLQVRFQDGTTNRIRAVWVTAPIDAGFFLYKLSSENRRPGHEPVAVELIDGNGKLLASQKLPVQPRVAHTRYEIPGFGNMVLPSSAIFSRRRLLFETTATLIKRATSSSPGGVEHTRVGLWIAPERGGGSCYWYGSSVIVGGMAPGISSACTTESPSRRPAFLNPNFGDGTICCWAGANVTRVELRYEDGARTELRTKQGYLLYAIPRSHYARGHRLDRIVSYSPSGEEVTSRAYPTDRPGMYPCTKPSKEIAGTRLCP